MEKEWFKFVDVDVGQFQNEKIFVRTLIVSEYFYNVRKGKTA